MAYRDTVDTELPALTTPPPQPQPLPPPPPPDGPPPVTTFESWDDKHVNLSTELLRGIYAYGFEQPSAIQKKAIIPMAMGRDVLAQAQSGTGKTGAFTVGTLQLIDTSLDVVQALILAPTRELADQINSVVLAIGRLMNVRTLLAVGGTRVQENVAALTSKNPPHIVVGCLGRVLDLVTQRHALHPSTLKIVILDEADEMLSQGFKEQTHDLFQYLPQNAQVCLFSATIPIEVESLTEKFLRHPVKLLVKQEMLTLEGIKQYYIGVDSADSHATDDSKFDVLKDLFAAISMSQCIVYCNTRRRCDDLYKAMQNAGFSVMHINGDMDAHERKQACDDLRSGKVRVLITTDLFARGIDVQQVSYVINFDIPRDVCTYLHRIGRSGRWGRKGVAINFMSRAEQSRVKDIEQYYHTEIQELPLDFAV
jgi:translation initiation factor 4A